ncbi:hypothetical protein DFH09DRAFT_1069509 [Mycena vulgaris]|nr:hypothetical protein DFH09DRAFT_1069509 [Mycena vulgaris]
MHDDDSNSETGLRVTLGGRNSSMGMFVDEVIDLSEAPECWPVPRHRVAYILDVTATPECLQAPRRQMSVDGYAKKQASVQWNIVNDAKKSILQCQDTWNGPTGNKKRGLAKVTILDEGAIVECRRSNLRCNGFFTCSLASDDFLSDFERWEDDSVSATQDLISGPTRTAKIAEASDVAAVATAFYRIVTNQNCKIKTDSLFPCGGHAILRKFREGKSNSKAHFVGCSNWVDGDGLSHRLTKIPAAVREDILRQLFRGEEIVVEDAEIVEGFCSHIVHPSHLPMNKVCQLLILIPVDETDLRAVVIPKFDIPHCHPTFLRTKVPFAAAQKYNQCIEAAGPIGTTTLRVNKAASTKSLLSGKLPQEVHPSLINNCKCREMVQKIRTMQFPEGTGLRAVWNEFENEQSQEIQDRYIHAVTMQTDMHVIITVNPELAALVHDASWIMVDTTFGVVHGTTNDWKLLIWLNGLDKCEFWLLLLVPRVNFNMICTGTVIGRVWSNRATREAFVLVWNGIFEAITKITGKAIDFKVFSKASSLLGAIGHSEGAQAQGLGDVIILRGMNSSAVNGIPTVTVNGILVFIWKTCIVHFK